MHFRKNTTACILTIRPDYLHNCSQDRQGHFPCLSSPRRDIGPGTGPWSALRPIPESPGRAKRLSMPI